MKLVTLLRHAKASPPLPEQEDRLRPLNGRGVGAAEAVGRETSAIIPDLVLCSDSVRTRETMLAVARHWPRTPPIEFAEDLYLASVDHLMDRLRELDDPVGSVWVVGHNPDLHELAIRFAIKGGNSQAREKLARFPTCARAEFGIDIDKWDDLPRSRPRLLSVVIPD